MRRLHGAAAAVLVLAVLQPLSAAAADEELPTVSDADLARSITVFRPTGSVTVFRTTGSVQPVESERQDGAQTVVSLDSDILFAFGSAELSRPAVQRVGELVADVPRRAAVSVTGHTDSIGDPASNLRLSRGRARAVAAAVSAERPDLRLTTAGRGDTEPVAPNTRGGKDDPEGRALNRRVEIRYAD